MLGTRDLSIVLSDTSFYWNWEPHHGSRFKSVRFVQCSNPILYLVSFTFNSNTLPFNVCMSNRFAEVAVLRQVWRLEIRGKISCRMLSPTTTYAAYFVFKMKKRKYYGFSFDPIDATVGIVGGECRTKSVCLDPYLDNSGCGWLHQREPWAGIIQPENNMLEFEQPSMRSDGWFEIELGEFQTDGEDDVVEVILSEVNGSSPKSGLVLQGIEIRPKTGSA